MEVGEVDYGELIPLLLKEVQNQHQALSPRSRQLEAQSQQLAEMKAQNDRLQAIVTQNVDITARLKRLEAVGAQRAIVPTP